MKGLHNVENVLAALAAGLAAGAGLESMKETVRNFKGVEHRIEYVDAIGGVAFYNDSKATSVDATLKALEAMSENEGKVILILGGRGKNAPYAPLVPLIERTVRSVVVIGEDADNIESQLRGAVDIVRGADIDNAAAISLSSAETGDVVLLAPACASFDMFESYEARGREFKRAVARLKLGERSRVKVI